MSGLYVNGKTNLGKKNIDLVNDQIIAVLVDTAIYIPDLINDEVQADIPTEAIISEKTLTGKSWNDAVFDADDVTFSSLSSDSIVGAVVLVKYNDDLGLSYLLFIDDSSPAFPVTPDSTDFVISWDDTETKIFKL